MLKCSYLQWVEKITKDFPTSHSSELFLVHIHYVNKFNVYVQFLQNTHICYFLNVFGC